MYQLTKSIECNKRHKVYIEKIKIKKVKEPKFTKKGVRVLKKGVPQFTMVNHEEILSFEVETFLSKYNAQSRIDNINFDCELKMRDGTITRARLGD